MSKTKVIAISLAVFDWGPEVKVVVYRSRVDKSKVSLICGGGSGHEPSHPAFVGAYIFLLLAF